MTKDKTGESGFTILEILVALLLSSVLLFFIYEIFSSQNRLQIDENQRMTLQQDGRAALNLMANGMRLAGYSPRGTTAEAALNGNSASAGITVAAFNGITYTCDLNENGQIDTGETISFQLNATDPTILERSVGGASQPLLTNVVAFSILYAWDVEGKGASSGYGDLEPTGAATNWGVDSDGDGALDLCYQADATGALILAAPIALNPTVPLNQVRGARIWLLLESDRKKQVDVSSNTAFSVPLAGANSSAGALDTGTLDSDRSHRLFTTTVKLRNMYF
ncbi:hypothetical protein DSLASN_48900 [Desulfoluna limicola]|uniref:Prepilin-type N-terminal cleavage/methylation domain-containing protein n=1 Tax=Desulfoluna limicola TaxID=2810562 RepID=A0ABM7PNY6_9BACT|nr:prepilin-type N-terminal cleavage/methylation domain-containing protein [Desulfoluna limicola]BCS99258.1 hypothetical protein DSLASN_48900 [Desulfoluna limicola]